MSVLGLGFCEIIFPKSVTYSPLPLMHVLFLLYDAFFDWCNLYPGAIFIHERRFQ